MNPYGKILHLKNAKDFISCRYKISDYEQYWPSSGKVRKVELILQQAVEAHRLVIRRDFHIFSKISSEM
jgi:hypothetical protein